MILVAGFCENGNETSCSGTMRCVVEVKFGGTCFSDVRVSVVIEEWG
jgi:hypothetical protein